MGDRLDEVLEKLSCFDKAVVDSLLLQVLCPWVVVLLHRIRSTGVMSTGVVLDRVVQRPTR